jgi:hypothetical protein
MMVRRAFKGYLSVDVLRQGVVVVERDEMGHALLAHVGARQRRAGVKGCSVRAQNQNFSKSPARLRIPLADFSA